MGAATCFAAVASLVHVVASCFGDEADTCSEAEAASLASVKESFGEAGLASFVAGAVLLSFVAAEAVTAASAVASSDLLLQLVPTLGVGKS